MLLAIWEHVLSGLRVLPALFALFCGACAPVVSGRPARRVPTDTISVAALAEAKTTSTVATTPKALPAGKLRFETLRDALREDCRVDAEEETNFGAKEAFARTNECVEGRLKKARADQLIASRPNAERRTELLALEDSYDKLAEASCDFSEDVLWIDFETGQRDFGSMHGYALLACRERSAVERTYFMKTMAQGDIAGLVQRIRSVQEIGANQRALLIEKRDQMRALAFEPEPDPVDDGPIPLDAAERRELAARIDGIVRDARHHATNTCTAYPKLSEAFGDDGRCEAALSSYYASIGRYDREMLDGSDED